MVESERIANIQAEIRRYISEYILFGDGRALDPDASFQEDGVLDSMGFLELITFIEENFAVAIADHELIPENFDTLRKMSDFVGRKLHERAGV